MGSAQSRQAVLANDEPPARSIGKRVALPGSSDTNVEHLGGEGSAAGPHCGHRGWGGVFDLLSCKAEACKTATLRSRSDLGQHREGSRPLLVSERTLHDG